MIFGYLFKLTILTFLKISGFFANHPDNLESARSIKKSRCFFENLIKSSQSKQFFFNTNYIVFLKSFQTVFLDCVQNFWIVCKHSSLSGNCQIRKKKLMDILRENKSVQRVLRFKKNLNRKFFK